MLTARQRFRALFEHDTSELDRLPMLSLGTPSVGNFYRNWESTVATEDIPDEYVRITHFGDKTMNKWLTSEWHSISVGWPHNYPTVVLPKDHPAWSYTSREGKDLEMTIGSLGGISVTGTRMHEQDYGWYVNGYFTRQVKDGKTLEPWEVRDEFYAEHGEPWDDKFAPSEDSRKNFQKELQWYEEHCNDFSDQGFADFALMCSAGGLFEGTWEGMGSGTPAMSIMCRKYPDKLRTWLGQVKDMVMKNVKLQFELAEAVGAQLDFIWFWDDSGQKGRPLINPEYHKEFWVPIYKEVCDYVHAHNGFVIIHSCGFGESLVPNWIEAGIDAWQTIERAAQNEPARIRENFGNKIILIGAIDASNILTFAKSTDEVTAHVKQTMTDAVFTPEDACYVPGFTHDLLDCPVPNVRAAVDAMLQYGQIDEIRKLKE
ncbi:MAG TPA: uroporphyrinogen decarboxylase family protein [Candidatus Lokiarchaeia archaeon]|nr:uroporphyrinogen decarboxylase family protein [Candidatus Lokiarchaeia archaeon]